jgi:hypothetical protein
MNSNSATKTQNSEDKGFFSGLFNAAKNATSKAAAAVTGNKPNSTKKNNNTPTVAPVTAGVNISTNSMNSTNAKNSTAPTTGGARMRGGAASVNYSVPGNQRQPSEAVMNWATTAGAPRPSAAEMRNVAHGGSRRNRTRRNRTRRNKSSGGTLRNRRNRNRSRRNKSCGGTLRNRRNRNRSRRNKSCGGTLRNKRNRSI